MSSTFRSRSVWLVAVALTFLAAPAVPRGAGPVAVFELSISGKSWDTGVILNPGVKPPIGKVTNKNVTDVLLGTLPDYASDFLDLDASGHFYLLYDGKTQWRVATNPNGDDATVLHGQVANDGTFWMAAKYDSFMADADVFITGKVKFQKGTFNPSKVSGKLSFVSEAITTGLNLKFKTVKLII